MSAILVGFLLRLGQAALDSALTLIIGAAVAGVLWRMVGPAGTRRLFGRGWRGLVRGWTAGVLLPVCSLGVIPVAREMRRAGVPGGTVLSFVLAAPLLNPISFLYGLTLAEPVVILAFAAASLALSTAAGYLWDRLFAGPAADAEAAALARAADAEPAPAAGPRRILAVAATAARELSGRDLIFYAVGLVGSAALAAAIPFGRLQHTMAHADPTAPLLMTVLAVPVFTAPLGGMMKLGLMFDHGNSIGAAFVLFIFGIGTSLGTLTWLGVDFGWRRVLPWLAGYAGIVLGFAFAFEPLLYDTRKVEIAHTHAFDDYTCPFPAGTSASEAADLAGRKLDEQFGPLERPAAYALVGLIAAGFLVRRFDRSGAVERWLTAVPERQELPAAVSWWNRGVPGPVLGAVALIGLIGFSAAGAFVYYPAREACLRDMAAVRADAFSAVASGQTGDAVRHVENWDLLARKLEVGEYIRRFAVTPDQAEAADHLREALEEVRDKLLAGDREAARLGLLHEVDAAFKACKAAYPW